MFSEVGSSFVPDGTRLVLARSPSDESLGYFRASLRDLGSRYILMRYNRWVAGDRFPVVPRMTRVSRTNTDSKVPSGTTDNSTRFQPWVADARTTRARSERKRRTWRPTKISARAAAFRPRGAPKRRYGPAVAPSQRVGATAVRLLYRPHFPARGEFRNVPGMVPPGSGVNVALLWLVQPPR